LDALKAVGLFLMRVFLGIGFQVDWIIPLVVAISLSIAYAVSIRASGKSPE
jgi:hypothetical protein